MKKIILLFCTSLISLLSYGQDLSKGLIAYYPFNGNANDESGNSNNGIVNGASLTRDRNNNENSAYYFNGNSYIQINKDLSGLNEVSVSCWVKVYNNQNDFQALVSSTEAGEFLHLQILVSGGNSGPYVDGNLLLLKNPSPYPLNQWKHIAIVVKSGQTKIYENGIVTSGSQNSFSRINSTRKILIGAGYKYGRKLNGEMDDIYFYNRALSETEILQLYNNSSEPVSSLSSQLSNNTLNVNIYESIKKYDCYTSVTPEIYNLKTQELFLLKLSDNTLSLVSAKDWTEKKKIKNEEDEKMKLSSSYAEGNDMYIALYNQKKNEIPNYLKLNLSTLETEKIKCSKTERGCIISSASSDYIKPEKNKPYKLNENVIFFRNDGTQYYYEVSKIVEEKEDYSKALNGNYKDKVNFLKKYQNSTYSKEVEKKLFDNLKSIKEVATFSKENSDYNEKSVNRAYEIAKSTKSKTELNDFINNFGSSKFASEIKAKLNTIENEEEQQRIANENARIQREKEEQNRLIAEQKAREQKIADDKKREAEYQKYLADKEKNRISKIKSATEGDKICYVQNRVSVYDDRDYFFGFQIGGSRQEVNYSMKVICFVEKNLGEKIQIRVGTVSSSNKKEYAQVVIDGVEYSKGDILWIKPLKNSNWFIED